MARRDSEAIWDQHVHGALFKTDNKQGPPVPYRELCSMLCISLDGRGVQGIMNTCICMTGTITTLLIPQYKIKSTKKKPMC